MDSNEAPSSAATKRPSTAPTAPSQAIRVDIS
jgi:hypothetical protein